MVTASLRAHLKLIPNLASAPAVVTASFRAHSKLCQHTFHNQKPYLELIQSFVIVFSIATPTSPARLPQQQAHSKLRRCTCHNNNLTQSFVVAFGIASPTSPTRLPQQQPHSSFINISTSTPTSLKALSTYSGKQQPCLKPASASAKATTT